MFSSRIPYCFFVLTSIATASCNQSDALFERMSASKTNIKFENNLEKKDRFGILYYLYYYNGGGVATGDVNNDGLTDIYFTANSRGNNKLYINKGNFEFEDVTETARVWGNSDWCTGVTMADVNGDGLLDIYVSAVANAHGLQGHNELYINNGNLTFTEKSAEYGLNFSGFTTQAAFFDYDHDGDLDCYVLNQSHKPNENIVDTSNRRKVDPYAGDRLYRNDLSSTKKFTDVSAAAGIYQSSLGYGLGLAIADLNNDGWDDIYVGNDFHENDYYYVNNGNGTFAESSAKHFRHFSRFSMGNDVADYNNDGQLDVVTVDMLPQDEKVLKTYGSDENPDIYKFKVVRNGFQYQYSRNCLQRNNGNGSSFSEIGLVSGISATDWSWAPLFADFDNDGNKDLFISSGIIKRPVDMDYVRFISNLYMQKAMDRTDKYDDEAMEKMPDGSSYPFFFRGDGAMQFKDMSEDWGTKGIKGYFNGAAYADLDNDGNLDMVINSLNAPAVVLRNKTAGKNHATISFKGEGLNTTGIGTKAYLFSKGKMQYQQLMLTRGFQSSVEPKLHFGLDSTNVIDSLLVVWPDQRFLLIKNPPINQLLIVDQKAAAGQFNYNQFFAENHDQLSDLSSELTANWAHRENEFVDFNIQYLIPHAQSTRGPKLATADVNGDGLDDIYACGGAGQPGALLVQDQSGRFISQDTAVFRADAGSEDVDALFFDANKDGAPDLYVVSGGNEFLNNDERLNDRLYLNDGKGHFSKLSGLLPSIKENKSCVAASDIDKDGDLDLFVGNFANAKAYGLPQNSYLLINDGAGKFTIASGPVFDKLGMVTDAVFADLNNDGAEDLVVVGEWMPVTVFSNKNGKFEKVEIPNSSGWWQTVLAEDLNGDGRKDLLAGNWGCNNKFWSGKNGPMRLYVSDYDKNGQTDQLMSYTFNGTEYPFLAKDEVERVLPLLKKHYLRYSEYAGVQMKDVFYGWIDTIKPYTAEHMASVVFYGTGDAGFKLQDLPMDLQLAPIFSFAPVQTSLGTGYLSGGNFFDVIPYEGRYDAQPLALFGAGKNGLRYMHQQELSSVDGQVRDIKKIRTSKFGEVYVVARNNAPLLFLGVRSR